MPEGLNTRHLASRTCYYSAEHGTGLQIRVLFCWFVLQTCMSVMSLCKAPGTAAMATPTAFLPAAVIDCSHRICRIS